MMNISTLSGFDVALVVAALCLGLVLGYFLSPVVRKAGRLRAELDDLRKEHEAYKAGVKEHFRETADLVGEMTKTYAAVYDHLAGGARHFCGDGFDENALVFGASLAALGRTNGGASAADDVVLIETPKSTEADSPALEETELITELETEGIEDDSDDDAEPGRGSHGTSHDKSTLN